MVAATDLADPTNRDITFGRICTALGGGKAMPHLWGILLGTIEGTLQQKAWATEDEATRCLMHNLGRSAMMHATVAKGHVLSPDCPLPWGEALARNLGLLDQPPSEEFAQNQPLSSIMVAIALVMRYRDCVKELEGRPASSLLDDLWPLVLSIAHRQVSPLLALSLSRSLGGSFAPDAGSFA